MPNDVSDDKVDAQQCHLVPAEDDECGHEPGKCAGDDRIMGKGSAQKQQGDGEICQTEDLAEMLQSPGHCRTEGETRRGQKTCSPMPSHIPAQHKDTGSAEQEHGKYNCIDSPYAR